MKTCANCETELITSLDEYGPANAPLCRACFFQGTENNPREIERLEEEIEELQDDIRAIDREIDDLEGQKDDKKDEIRALRAKIKDIQNPQPKAAVTSLSGLPIFAGA
jgi:peptidoglycan hydrolase CwlO-like protein